MALNQGDYRVLATVVDFVFGTASTGTFQMAVAFDLEADAPPEIPQRITGYCFFGSEGSEAASEKSLRAMGWDPTIHNWDLSALHESRAIIGAKVALVVCEEEYNGKYSWKVKFINSRDGGMLKNVATADEVSEFTKKLQARLLRRPAGSTPPRSTPASQAPSRAATVPQRTPQPTPQHKSTGPAFDDDDIPF